MYGWIGRMHELAMDSVGKYFCRVCLCINYAYSSNSTSVYMDWTYVWIGHSVGKYYGCVCSCINMLIAGLPILTDFP